MSYPIALSLCVLVASGLGGRATAQSLTPFGDGLKAKPIREVKAATVETLAPDFLSAANSSRWIVEVPPWWEGTVPPDAFTITGGDEQRELRIDTTGIEPELGTVRVLMPGDGGANGNVWAKAQANHISFLCKSDTSVAMTFHLLFRGKTAGTYKTGFDVEPGDWQRVILPIEAFGLTSFRNAAGIGFRTVPGEPSARVQFKDFKVAGMAYTDRAWQTRLLSIDIDGDWHFKTDPGDEGTQQQWFADGFDATGWQTLKSGTSWQKQGVEHYGWGWYRQQVFVPAECEGTPLTITLCKIDSDDDVWVNGQRVGGWHSEYKYNNQLTRTYTVPASLVRYGQTNTIAVRIWGGDLTFIGDDSGLVKGPLRIDLDPYPVQMREPGGEAVPAPLFDLSEAQRGEPFEMVFAFPTEVAAGDGVRLNVRLTDVLGNTILKSRVPFTGVDELTSHAVVSIDREEAHTVYLRGRLHANLIVEDAQGTPLYCGTRELEHLRFAKRDSQPLPALPEAYEDTPYGKLKLVDVIDCATPAIEEDHPYTQSGFDKPQDRMPPGSPVDVRVTEILGKKARESAYGWFAYRIGRGQLKPHSTYLLRIEYPEDKPRFSPIEVQTGQNYMDVGWKNGLGPDDVYDNWPLSHAWQWYDVIVPLDDQTVGNGGTGSASAENGLWVYFMNKQRPGMYYAMWDGGPAVARMKLYEIDPVENAPAINLPEDLPHRTLAMDWERQPDHDPLDFVKYAKLMGYNAVSPIMIKWHSHNYSPPLNGYDTVVIDDHDYWAHKDYDPASGQDAASPIPANPSQHERYLAATKQFDIQYIPRFEWGGSKDLPEEAKAIDTNGQLMKPNRFHQWCGNLLHPATWDDLETLIDHLVGPYVQDNPQFTGLHWRIRCNRMPISYGEADIRRFAEETNTPLPGGKYEQWAAWASGEMKSKYDTWWHQKRAEFHGKLVDLMRSYRPDMTLYYFNWDPDKFGIIEPDITAWGFVKHVVEANGQGKAVYQAERDLRKTLTADDYTSVMHTGNFGNAFYGLNRADLGIRPELYKDMPGIELFAPANYLCYADLPDYLNYFQTADGVAVSNVVSYDEIGARTINPKYEGNMITPAGANFSMALELLSYFHSDARTLNYTVYTYGRGFADAHRRFAQAFLALPAIPGQVIEQGNPDLKVRAYPSPQGTYLGVAYRGHEAKPLTMTLPDAGDNVQLTDLVTGEKIPTQRVDNALQFKLEAEPMTLHAFRITTDAR